MEEAGVQSSECLLQNGVGGGPRQPEALKDLRHERELGDKGPIAEASIKLEAQEDKEGGEGEVRRATEGGGPCGEHSTKVDKCIKQELRMTSLGGIV